MKILLTGATGFLGKTILEVLKDHEIATLARSESSINADLSNHIPHLGIYDLVVHSAGKAHVIPKNQSQNEEFFKINVGGTLNLLEGLNRAGLPKAFVFISSVSVYGAEQGKNIDEDAALNATTPYGLSKIESERAIIDWGIKHQVPITILRLPLIVGHAPKGNLGALINAISKGYYFRINGIDSLKSVVLAEDVARLLPELIHSSGIYNLTDGLGVSSRELEDYIAKHFNKRIKTLPFFAMRIVAKIGDVIRLLPINTRIMNKLTSTLTFSSVRANKELNWNPTPILKSTWL